MSKQYHHLHTCASPQRCRLYQQVGDATAILGQADVGQRKIASTVSVNETQDQSPPLQSHQQGDREVKERHRKKLSFNNMTKQRETTTAMVPASLPPPPTGQYKTSWTALKTR